MLFILIISLFSIKTSITFYLPGQPPVTYCESQSESCQSEIPVYVNRLNSLRSLVPYKYSRFPFCPVSEEDAPSQNLGQVLIGDRIVASPYKAEFKRNTICNVACNKTIKTGNELEFLKKGISLNYQHNWIIDDMPVTWCYQVQDSDMKYCSLTFPVGCLVNMDGRPMDACVISVKFQERDTYYLFNHVDITITYHSSDSGVEGRILSAKIEPKSIKHLDKAGDEACNTDEVLGIKKDQKDEVAIKYTYSIYWEENNIISWGSRWDYILGTSSTTNIHLFSIVNDLVTVFLLFIVLWKTHRNANVTNGKDPGWKLVYDDVFRTPNKGRFLAILIGNGIQFLSVAFLTLIFASLGVLSPVNRGAFMTTAVSFFVCMGAPAGYFSSRFYKTFNGQKWLFHGLITALFGPGILFSIYLCLNLMLWAKGSSAAIPITSLVILLALWFGIMVPLTVVGSFFGFRKPPFQHPVKSSDIPRPIPRLPFYKRLLRSTAIFGILPFGCIFIQLFFIFNGLWAQETYYVFGYLGFVFILLIVTCSLTTIIICYFGLCSENYHWWWQSFLSGGFTAVFFFVYCITYFVEKMEVTDATSIIIYFGYSVIMFLSFFLMTGVIGFLSTFKFITWLYRSVNIDDH